MRFLRWPLVGAAALAGYALYEPFRYRLEVKDVPLRAGAPGVTILHVSDLHMSASDRRLRAFLASIPEELEVAPDFVIATGDLIQGNEGIAPALEALSLLEGRLGRFYVLGSHDYFLPAGPGYSKYFFPSRRRVRAGRAATDDLEAGLHEKGWISLSNRTEVVERDGGRIRVAGVDDPYLQRHRTDHIERAADDVLAIGVTHAPDVVSEWALNGYDIVLAGHTHGGQVRVPLIGPVVTNSTLPAALAGGLHRIGGTWLHVSRGLGNGKYTPIRFGCPPEISLLKLRPRA